MTDGTQSQKTSRSPRLPPAHGGAPIDSEADREARLAALKEAINGGQYRIPSAAVAEKIISSMKRETAGEDSPSSPGQVSGKVSGKLSGHSA